MNFCYSCQETYIYDLKNEEGDEVLSLQAFLEPLQLSSMSKDMDAVSLWFTI